MKNQPASELPATVEHAPLHREQVDEANTQGPGLPGSFSPTGMPVVRFPSRTAWPQIPGYQILAELGRGGMGVVYKAEQVGLKRTVALKMILGGQMREDTLRRFQAEAEAIAELQHPHIVQIYEVGQYEGQAYCSLEFAPGGSLDQHVQGTPWPPGHAAALVETLAAAMQAAHDQGIVHRDLKPANILLAGDSAQEAEGKPGWEVASDRTPKISDFGLAKRLDTDSGQTQSGAILGTPSYMAPEQAAGKSKTITPAADVYALGAILYELLTGKPPFKGATILETLEQVMSATPVPPRELRPGIPRALETICLVCLHKEPNRRYPSAQALAEDLRRFQQGEASAAQPDSLLGRLARTLGHNRLQTEFQTWGNLLLLFAAIVFTGHLLLDHGYQTRQPILWIVALDCAQFALMGLALWLAHYRQRPILAEEHRLWLLGIGYIMACALVRLLCNVQSPDFQEVYAMREYPFWCVLASLLFFMMGGAYWGYCYLFSAGFALGALLIVVFPTLSVLAFGTMWSLSLCCFGLHMRRLGHAAHVRPTP